MDITAESEAFARSLRARGRSPETIKTYLKAVYQLRDYLTDDSEITKTTIETFLLVLQGRGLSPVTVAQRYRSMAQFFAWWTRETGDPSPMADLQPPAVHVDPPPVLSPEVLRRLFDACRGNSFTDRRDLAILSLFADTGIRRGEMASISLEGLDLREQVVLVTGKTGPRGVPYGSETATRLDRYLRARRQHPDADLPWLWLGRKGRFTAYGIEGAVENRGKQAGVKVHPHLFRHTFAHMWLDGGGNETDLQRLAGWRSPAMLQRYGASAASARARRAYLAGRSPVDRLKTV